MASMQLPQNINVEPNMGTMDRIVRSALGGMLLMSGLMMPGRVFGRIETMVGGAFIFYGITGFDPLLKIFHTSTKPEDQNSVMNKVKPKPTMQQSRSGDIESWIESASMTGIGV